MAPETGSCSRAEALIRAGEVDDLTQINRVLEVLSKGAPLPVPTTFVADIRGAVVGCASIYMGARHAWVANVAVDKSLRRTGIGRQLMEACVEEAIQRRMGLIWLETMFWNRVFYEKLGFEFVPIARVPEALKDSRRNTKCLMMCADVRDQIAKRRTPSAAMQPRASVLVEAF